MNLKNLKTASKLRVSFSLIIALTLMVILISTYLSNEVQKQTNRMEQILSIQKEFTETRLHMSDYLTSHDTIRYNNATLKIEASLFDLNKLKETLTIQENIKKIDSVIMGVKSYHELMLKNYELIQKQEETAKKRKITRNDFIKKTEELNIPSTSQLVNYFNQTRLFSVYLLSSIKEDYYNQAKENKEKAIEEAVKLNHPELNQSIENYWASVEEYYLLGLKIADYKKDQIDAGAAVFKSSDEMLVIISEYIKNTRTTATVVMWFFLFIAIAFTIIISEIIVRYMTKTLHRGVTIAENFAAGDLTFQINQNDLNVKDEFGLLTRAINNMGEKIRGIINDVQNGASEVASASIQISSASQVISQGANEQSAAVEELSAAIEEMTSGIQQNSDNAVETDKSATIAAHSIREVVKVSSESIDSVHKIVAKINIINDIAFQTNILALNAAVEAARAGEQGRGFAVVAAEVRKLAERSKTAANEIMELSASTLQLSEQSGQKLSDIVPKIEQTAKLVQEIAAASYEQSSGVMQINNTIQQFNNVTQQNAASSEEMATSAEELAGQAGQLKDTVSFFKI